jgi:hypothetical protein
MAYDTTEKRSHDSKRIPNKINSNLISRNSDFAAKLFSDLKFANDKRILFS